MRVKRWDVLAGTALVLLVFGMQYASGAYHSDFAADEDEPAHVVSSLMVRDYLATDAPHNPLQFAKSYYLHYPKVAIGHWPPGFHFSEALWMLLFGRTRTALISFVGLASAVLALSVFVWIRRDTGTLLAFLSASILATRPVVQIASFSAQTDILLALCAFCAVASYDLFVEQRRRRYLIAFIIFTLCALAVHGRGAVLAFLPPVAELIAGRSKYNKIWISAILALAAVAVLVPRILGQAEPSTFETVFHHAWKTLYQLCVLVGWPVAVIAAFGALAVLRARASSPACIAMIALVLSNWIFASLVNVSLEERYLLIVIPIAAVLFAKGWRFFTVVLSEEILARRVATAMFLMIALVAIGRNALAAQKKRDLSCHQMLGEPGFPRSPSNIYLVAGGAIPEGAFIAEMALRDSQLKNVVLRASKVLAASSWSGFNYQMRFSGPEAIGGFLDRAHVGLVLIEPVTTPEHMVELAATVKAHREIWQLVPDVSPSGTFLVFRRITPIPAGAPDFHIDLRDKLGQYLQPGN